LVYVFEATGRTLSDPDPDTFVFPDYKILSSLDNWVHSKQNILLVKSINSLAFGYFSYKDYLYVAVGIVEYRKVNWNTQSLKHKKERSKKMLKKEFKLKILLNHLWNHYQLIKVEDHLIIFVGLFRILKNCPLSPIRSFNLPYFCVLQLLKDTRVDGFCEHMVIKPITQ